MSNLNQLFQTLSPMIAHCNQRDRGTLRDHQRLTGRFRMAIFWRDQWSIQLQQTGAQHEHRKLPTLSISHERFPSEGAHHTDRLDISIAGMMAVVSRYNQGWTNGGAVWVGSPNGKIIKPENVLDLAKGWMLDSRRMDNQLQVRRPAWHREKLGVTLVDELAFRL